MSSKPHFKANTVAKFLALNSVRREFISQFASAHLSGTKHNKSYAEYGYKEALDFFFFYSAYTRIGLGAAVIDRLVSMCWLHEPVVRIDEETTDEQHEELAERLELWPIMAQLDAMQCVGNYAGLFIRVADGQKPEKPLGRFKQGAILEVVPCWQGQLTPSAIDNNPQSARYGLPESYTYHQRGVSQQNQRDGNESITIHHSRILIWNEGAAGNTIYGTSRLEKVYNALVDWEKLRGAGAEGFWRNAAMRGVLEAADATSGQMPSDEEMESLTETIMDMMQSFDSLPFLGGMKLNTLSTSMPDSKSHAEIVLNDVAAGAGWSAKGLVGAQEGVLAGGQDTDMDRLTAQSRRTNYLSRMIKRWLKWLEAHTDYDASGKWIEWPDLMAPSDTMRLANAQVMWNMRDPMTGEKVFEASEIRELAGWDAKAPEIEEESFLDGE